MSGTDSISQVLLESVRERLRVHGGTSTVEVAVRAALEPEPEQRSWVLVVLARRLRAEGHRDLARLATDAAIALDAGPEPTRAARVCALALLADDREHEAAVKLGEELLAERQELELVKTMARVYWGLWQETEDETWHERWWRMSIIRRQAAKHAA